MDVKRFGTTVALSCFIAATHPPLANASGQGRGGATATGSHSGGRGTAGGAGGRAQGRAPRSGTVIRSRPPTTARPDSPDARTVTGWPTQAVGLASPADPNPRDSAETDVAPAPPKASVSSESSSIQPLLLSPLPQTSPSSPRGTLRLDTAPVGAQLYIDGFYAGTVEEANRTEAGLSLPAGWHRLEIRAPGFVTPAINVTIEADRTVSYHAELIPLQR